MSPKNPPLHIYVFHRTVAVRIFAHLPLESLLTCMRVSRRFNTLITRCAEIQPHLFLEPPGASPPVAVPVSLHPVFGRLNFSAYHPAKAIRLGQGLDGGFLVTCGVRHQFATSPALREMVIRVISGGEWPLDVEITVTSEEGVTVWDVAKSITGFFNEFSHVSFGDHFGVDFCRQHEWDPKALMQNHEFLNPDSPFPTIYIPDRKCNNMFIADYIFNGFAAMPLVLCPVEWRTGRKEVENGVGNLAFEDQVGGSGTRKYGREKSIVKGKVKKVGEIEPAEEIKEVKEAKDIEPAKEMGEVKEIKSAGEIEQTTEIKLVEKKQKDLEQTEETQDDDLLGSMGSQSMDIDNDSDHRKEFHPSCNSKNSNEPDSSSPPTRQAVAAPRSLVRKEKQAQEEFDKFPFSFKVRESASPASTSGDIALPSTELCEHLPRADTPSSMKGDMTKLNCIAFPGLMEVGPALLTEIPVVVPVILTTDINIGPNSETSETTSIQDSTEQDCGPIGWEDAFD